MNQTWLLASIVLLCVAFVLSVVRSYADYTKPLYEFAFLCAGMACFALAFKVTP